MANRLFVPQKGILERGMVTLYCTIATSTAGAVVAATSGGKGILSVTRQGVGQYDIVLSDKYVGLREAIITVRGTAVTGVPTAAKASYGVPYNFTGNNTISIQMLSALAAADVTDAWFIDICFHLKDSVV